MLTFLGSDFSIDTQLYCDQRHLPSKSSSLATFVPVPVGAVWVEVAVQVNVNRDVENVRIIVKGLLDAVSCKCVSA